MPSYENQDKRLTGYAKNMRGKMTPQEFKLWSQCLRNLPLHIRRQAVVGNYILDFYCAKRKIAIEIDGGQHFEEEGPGTHDAQRDAWLASKGLMVIRYSNREVDTDFDGVCADIRRQLGVEEGEPASKSGLR